MKVNYRFKQDFLNFKKGHIIECTDTETEVVLRDNTVVVAKLPTNSPLLEKVIEKDAYTILSVKTKHDKNKIWTLNENIQRFIPNHLLANTVYANYLGYRSLIENFNILDLEIVSVRRNSGGVIFKIADKISNGVSIVTIEKFRYITQSREVVFFSKEFMIKNDYYPLYGYNIYAPIVLVQSDEDKIYHGAVSELIYEGEDFWFVQHITNEIFKYNSASKKSPKQLKGAFFKTEKAAKDYVAIINLAVSLKLQTNTILESLEGKVYRVGSWSALRKSTIFDSGLNKRLKVFGFKYFDNVPSIIADSVAFNVPTNDYYIIPAEQFIQPKITLGKKKVNLTLTSSKDDVRVFIGGDYVSNYKDLLKFQEALETVQHFKFGSRPIATVFCGSTVRTPPNFQAFVIGAYTVSAIEISKVITECKKLIEKANQYVG